MSGILNDKDGLLIAEIGGRLTLAGILEKYPEEFEKDWADSTQEQYGREYENVIIPSLLNHNDKTIDEYTFDDFEEAIERIKSRGKKSDGSPYSDATIQHFRWLIRKVIIVASRKGLCSDILWGTSFQSVEDFGSVNGKRNGRIRKSLYPGEESKIVNELFSDYKQSGQYMGLLLMYLLGLRNGEACGVNYGDIREMQYYPGTYVLWIYKSLRAGTTVLQSSGKTRNADRILPVPMRLVEFLEKRREYLSSVLTFSDEDEYKSVDDLPVCCIGDDYRSRCSAQQLSNAARELFREIAMDEETLSTISMEMVNGKAYMGRDGEDATAYLFRRNFATHLTLLGLTETEIKYVMGHDMTDTHTSRNEMTNEDLLYRVSQKMNRRPLVNEVEELQEVTMPEGKQESLEIHDKTQVLIHAPAGRTTIVIRANEPGDKLYVKVNSVGQSKQGQISVRYAYSKPESAREVDASKQYRLTYGIK